MTQIGGVFILPLLETTRGDGEPTRLSEPEPETSQNQSKPQKDIQVFSQVKSRLMELLRDSFMSLSNYILLNEEH